MTISEAGALIRFFTHNKRLTSNQKKRLDSLLARDFSRISSIITPDDDAVKFNSKPRRKNLDEIRKLHRPLDTSRFLALFSSPNGFKFLTHDFDPTVESKMEDIILQATAILDSKEYRIPKSLYALMFGFLRGSEWWDFKNVRHSIHMKSEEVKNWISQNPTLHLKTSPKLKTLIEDFRNTTRLVKPNLPHLINRITNNNDSLLNLIIEKKSLNKADFYTNVRILNLILQKVFLDIAQRDAEANIEISFLRDSWNEYRLCQIIVKHSKSESSPLDDVKNKMESGGGALFELGKLCQGYCDWSIEGNFEGERKRWRILDSRRLPEIEDLEDKNIEDFIHVFTFYKYK
ncbi:MAG: hypothetical protein K2M31_05975 [Muribaculaceae bacterium]|nr:hypothetical protein [Muribaculaceae bacterium]